MRYIEFDKNKKYDLILVGRVAVDLNPVDYYCPLNESTTFKRYLGGSPANIAVGLARLGKKCGFIARVSDDQLGTFLKEQSDAELRWQILIQRFQQPQTETPHENSLPE